MHLLCTYCYENIPTNQNKHSEKHYYLWLIPLMLHDFNVFCNMSLKYILQQF